MEHYKMKNLILAILLVAIVTSTHNTCSCGGSGSTCCSGSGSTYCSGSGCNSCSPCDPSFDVNSKICVEQPSSVSPPECIIPEVNCPETCPPPVEPPSMEKCVIDVDSIDVPCVVHPPKVDPPSVEIPPPEICIIRPPPPPPLPPCIEEPSLPHPPKVCPPSPPIITSDMLSRYFTLTFQYACRKNVNFQSCQLNVIWNDVILTTIIPNDYQVHTYNLIVKVDGGENKLQFEGAGSSNSFGITIDNVKLVRKNTNTNIVINGKFESPDVGYSWGVFNNIPGWEGIGIEVGWGKIYNGNWNSQVLELDGHKNYIITQKWSFDSQFKLVKQLPCDTNNFIGKSLLFKL